MTVSSWLLIFLGVLMGFLPSLRSYGCPEMNGFCSCEHERTLRCNDIGIQDMSFLHDNLHNDSFLIVELSRNNITAIFNEDLPFYLFPELLHLSMDHNALANIEELAFQELPTVKHIDLSYNMLEQLHTDTFRNNSQLRKINMSHNKLTNIDFVKKMPNLQYLILDNNRITALTNKTFSTTVHSQLYVINLRHNGMQNIEIKAFFGLTKLHFLLLEGNALTWLHPGTFRFTSNLRYLHLDDNKLTDLTATHNAINLREGYFSNNNISALTNDMFSGSSMAHLEELNLENNTVTVVRHRAFQRLRLLWKLNLSGNNISFLYPDTFHNTTSLDILNLSRNRLTNMEFVRNIPNLEYLLLSSNLITTLANETFCSKGDGSDLFRIDLSFNMISTIQHRAFQCLHDLEYLDMSHNNITFLHPDIFVNTTELIELNLSNNCISEIDALQNLRNLEVLYLSHNVVTILSNQTFSSTNSSRLKEIYLAKNGITTIEELAFEGIGELQVLDLSGNNISYMKRNTIPYIHTYYVT